MKIDRFTFTMKGYSHPKNLLLLSVFIFSNFLMVAQPDSKKLYENRYLFSKGNKVGVKDGKGKIILQPKYDEIELIETDFYHPNLVFSASLNTKRGLYHFSGKKLLEHKYDAIAKEQNFLILRVDDYTGACDTAGKILIEPGKYEKINFLRNSDHWLVTNKEGKRAIVNRNGIELTPFIIANVAPYPSPKQYTCILYETFANRIGVIGLFQDLGIFYSKFIPPVFTSIENYEFEGPPGTTFSALLLGDENNKLYWYSTVADTIVADSLTDIYPCMQYQGLQNHRAALVNRDGKTGLIGASEGEIIIPYLLDDAYPLVDVYMMIGKNGHYGFIDITAFIEHGDEDLEEILNKYPLPFDFVMEISSSDDVTNVRFIAGTSNAYYLLNYRGDTIVNSAFTNVSFEDCLEYFIQVEQNDLKGMYNIRGANVIPIKYNTIEPVYLGETVYFIVSVGKKKGLYNANGTMLLDEKYSDIKLVVSDNILFDAYVGKRKRAAVNAEDKVILIR